MLYLACSIPSAILYTHTQNDTFILITKNKEPYSLCCMRLHFPGITHP